MSIGETTLGSGASDATLQVTWPDGHRSSYSWLWLRDCCGCEQCRGDGTGQRMASLLAVPAAPRPERTTFQAGALVVSWRHDGHESRYDSRWLLDHCGCPEHAARRAPAPRRWRSKSPEVPFRLSWEQVRHDDAALEAFLAAVSGSGLALLSGAGTAPGKLFEVVGLFGYVRETNYGRSFDVVTTVDPSNLAFTSLPLGPHTDNPYRDPTPTLQLLHCLVSSTTGGESIFVDGLEAAAVLAAEDPAGYGLLGRMPVPWRYADASTELACEAPVFRLHGDGRLAAVRFNERARVPTRFPSELAEQHLAVLRHFAAILERPELQLRLRLEPGELVCFDNQRVLHGRTGYESGGERHLQGCYADRDGLESRLAVLRRRHDRSVPPGEGREEGAA